MDAKKEIELGQQLINKLWQVHLAQPGQDYWIKEAEKDLGGRISTWLIIRDRLAEDRIIKSAANSPLNIILTPVGRDVAQQSGGYAKYLDDKKREDDRKKRNEGVSAWGTGVSAVAALVAIGFSMKSCSTDADVAKVNSQVEILSKKIDSIADLENQSDTVTTIHPSATKEIPKTSEALDSSKSTKDSLHR